MRPDAPARALHFFLNASAILGVLALSACGGDSDPISPAGTVATVTITPATIPVVIGKPEQLTATMRDRAGGVLVGRTVTWTSSDVAVLTVTNDGLVTGVNAGTGTITATAQGISATAAVTVSRPSSVASFASVTAGGAHTCALTSVGAAYCWGRGESGQLGVAVPTTMCATDSGPFPCSMTPIVVGGGLSFTRLIAGVAHTCGLTSDGTTFCWGSNAKGQLGDGSLTNRTSPTAILSPLKFVALAAGAEHTCGLTSDGIAYCWGRNDRGQLGDGGTAFRFLPVNVATDLRFRAIAAGGSTIGHTCALTTAGAAYCWGDNERGQLGWGSPNIVAHPEPTPVEGGLSFSTLSAGLGRHICALTTAGVSYCWGSNTFGALGNGTFAASTVPTRVLGSATFSQIIAGGFIGHTCALTSAGAAWCWGENEVGAIGDGTTDDHELPVPVAGGIVFTALSAGLRHNCGSTSTGAVYCWGSNGAGQLGINSTAQRLAPTRVVTQP